jgi:fatty-acyl-CoA synthase
MLNMLAQYPELDKYDISSLRLIESGGAKLHVAIGHEAKKKLGCRIMASYGLTETAPVVTFAQDILNREGTPELEDDNYHRQVFGPGVETLDCAHKVVGDDGKEVKWDGEQVGEVLVRGNIVTDGYWDNPGATEEAFTSDKPRWLRTGDLAVVDADGYTHVVDRKKDLIIRGGENISSLELEDVLRTHPAVLEAAVIPVPSEKWGEDPLAVIVTKPGAEQDGNSILHHCRQNMAKFKVPARVEFITELPKSGTGKILKRKLREIYGN